ncbi:MAG TPA: glycine zipper domain-containing protein [Novosphingobium sp.]|nr:glycine zipper domain-containing protein [Novosphingobium sp.]
MKTSVLTLCAAASVSLAACTSTNDDRTLASAGTGAAIGAAGGAGVSAIAGGDILTGAAIGAAVGGLAGAVWADQNNDGRADGYYQNGRYYAGAPGSYQNANACRSVGGTALRTGAAGAAVGAGAGALIGGLSVLEGAAIGAAVGGLGGAVWADANNDGCVDGYMREGRYYEGTPVVQPTPASYRTGERG